RTLKRHQCRAPESQRDSILQPRVAELARLPWVNGEKHFQPQGGCIHVPEIRCNPFRVAKTFDWYSQGSSCLATPGLDDVAPLGQTHTPRSAQTSPTWARTS